jgi:hypothetical protein
MKGLGLPNMLDRCSITELHAQPCGTSFAVLFPDMKDWPVKSSKYQPTEEYGLGVHKSVVKLL